MMNWNKAIWLVVGLLATSPFPQGNDPAAALTKAEATWRARKPAAYEFTIEIRCFCPVALRPLSFRVIGDESTLLDKLDADVRQMYERYNTVDKVLAVLRRWAAMDPFKMRVEYDSTLGYPLRADLDHKKFTKDDELFFRVTQFRPLPAKFP
jgi:hypothetical protein